MIGCCAGTDIGTSAVGGAATGLLDALGAASDSLGDVATALNNSTPGRTAAVLRGNTDCTGPSLNVAMATGECGGRGANRDGARPTGSVVFVALGASSRKSGSCGNSAPEALLKKTRSERS